MASISATFLSRWRSGKHVGAAKPFQEVWIRRGRFDRRYDRWTGGDVGAYIPNQLGKVWQAFWKPELTPNGTWNKLPNVTEVRKEKDFDENGLTRVSIEIENINYKATSGIAGVYRAIMRGYYAPYRGFKPRNRPSVGSKDEQWYDTISPDAQIVVRQGYGSSTAVATFTGLVDTVDLDSNPDKITLSVRDFGKTLTDQSVFGWVKDKAMTEPVVFADSDEADDKKRVGGGAKASSSLSGHPSRFVLDDEAKSTAWISSGHGGPGFTEWVQVHVPRGRYEDFYLRNRYEGMEMFVSIFARGNSYVQDRSGHKTPLPGGWVDVGMGDVPGGNGGFPFVNHKNNIAKRGRHYTLGGKVYILGNHSTIRVSFRNLRRSTATRRYHAGVRRFAPIKRKLSKEARRKNWIIVADASDIVKVVLRWAGFKEWDIESTGVRLSDKLTFNRGNYLIDIINKVAELTNFVFFINDPASNPLSNDASLGIPTFRESRVVKNLTPRATIRDTDLLTGLKAHFGDESLAFPIRVRGKRVKRSNPLGTSLGADRTRRYQAFYHPPWALRLGYLIKHVIHYEPMYASVEECELAARYIALKEAIQAATAVCETPGNPNFELDSQVALFDTGTGLSTRIYVASYSDTFRSGEQASWKATVGGALIDTPDVQNVVDDINNLDLDPDEPAPLSKQTGPTGIDGPARVTHGVGFDAPVGG